MGLYSSYINTAVVQSYYYYCINLYSDMILISMFVNNVYYILYFHAYPFFPFIATFRILKLLLSV